MTTPLSFGTNNITVYSYEPFSYTISNPNVGLYTLSTTKTSGIPASYLSTDVSRVVFSTTSNGMTPGSQQFVITADPSGPVSTNNVLINPGRFTDVCRNSLGTSLYTFYAKEAIPPIRLYAPFNLASPVTSTPTLPPGLSFSAIDMSYIAITGTPLTTVPQSNYLIIGRESGTSKVVSSTLPIIISNERIRTDISGGGIFSPMQVGTDVSTNVITASGNGTIGYTWSSFPTGIFATDSSGNTVTSGFFPTDASKTLIIKGTPTLTTASNFRDAGYSNGVTQSVVVTRVTPAPIISNVIPLTFAFGETVLFDTPTVPTSFYKNVPLDPSQTYFRAATYFTSNVAISNISNVTALPSGMSLVFNGNDRAYLTGTPTVDVSSTAYTIRATNSNGTTRDISASFAVIDDFVTFPFTDTCYNFVISRNLDTSLNGYYRSPIQFSATSAAQKKILWSATGLSGSGLSLSDVSGPTTTLVGTPNAVLSLRNLSVTATAVDTSASFTRDVSYAVLDDTFFVNKPLPDNVRVFTQNKPITPIQLTGTTLSGTAIRTWSATPLISGTILSRSGVLTGTPTNTTPTQVNPTYTLGTGYTTGTYYDPSWGFYSAQDVALVTIPNVTETAPITFSNVPFKVLAYSETQDVSMNVSTSQAPLQGVNFQASINGTYLQGDFSVVPALLPKYRFGITGHAGASSNTWPVDVTVNNAPTFVRHIIGVEDDTDPENVSLKFIRNTGSSIDLDTAYGYTFEGKVLNWSNTSVLSSFLSNIPYGIHDMAQSGSVIVAVLGYDMVRSTDAGLTWSQISPSNIQTLGVEGVVPSIPYYTPKPLIGCIATDGGSNWVALANSWDGYTISNIVRTSSNNGATWTDTLAVRFVDINSNTKLYYNNSRYFVITGDSPYTQLLYADSSDVTNWIPVGLTTNDVINDLAFNGNTLLAVGSNGSSSACYSSTNNGTTWTPLASSPISYSGSAEINTAKYAHGQWVVGGKSAGGGPVISFSTDLITWNQFFDGTDKWTAVIEDGSAWMLAGPSEGITYLWDSSGSITDLASATWGSSYLPSVSTKRFTATTVSNGTPSLTFQMLYNSSGFSFNTPTQTDYIFWQYANIPTINIEANSLIVPAEAVYYFIDNLPDGLRMTLSPYPTYTATITGNSVTLSESPRLIRLYAVTANSLYVVPLTLSERTFIATVQKQLSGAGAWTYLLRQYTEVNSAVSARDNKATPANEYKLGEFMRPEPPSVITESSNCKC